jgi:hypothetical protein
MDAMDDLLPDAEPGDDSDPTYREEGWSTLHYMGVKPSDLPNAKDADEYAAWLAKQ